MRSIQTCAIVAGLLLAISDAAAGSGKAVLREVQGEVFVNQSKMYFPGRSGTTLNTNARVLTGSDSHVAVVHGDGCITQIGPNSLFILTSPSPCKGGAAKVQALKVAQTNVPPTLAAGDGTGSLVGAGGSALLGGGSSTLLAAGGATIVAGLAGWGIYEAQRPHNAGLPVSPSALSIQKKIKQSSMSPE